MKICVLGLWHLGSVTAGCLSALGHDVMGLELDPKVVKDLQAGTPPVFEPELATMVQDGIRSGRLTFISNPRDIAADVEVLWVTYDTPVNESDEADSEYVIRRIERVLPLLPFGVTVIISSQLPVGSTRRLEGIADQTCPTRGLAFVYSPENLRLGSAVDAFLKPDRVVIGIREGLDRARLNEMFRPITDRIEWMSVESAEMTKHAINAFLATSVVFANELASICESVGADAKQVERGLKTESRIGPRAYLSPGEAFSGGTLARDIEFLRMIGKERRLPAPLLEAIKASNDYHKTWARRKLSSLRPKLRDVIVAVWGLTYKPGTDTLRRSLTVEVCEWLIDQGARLQVHDPVVKEIPSGWAGHARRYDDPVEALIDAEILLVGTAWPEYRNVPGKIVASAAPGLIILDANGFLQALAGEPTLRSIAVGTARID